MSRSAADHGRRRGRVALAVVAVLLSGCGGGATASSGSQLRPAEVLAPAPGVGCPGGLGRLIDADVSASSETILALDFSGSFVGDESAQNRIRAQVRALVEQSVTGGQALRILAFDRSASGARTIVACPSLVPRFNNAAARTRKVENLKRQAAAAIDLTLQAALADSTGAGGSATSSPGLGSAGAGGSATESARAGTAGTERAGAGSSRPRGTSVVGGFLALEQSAPQVPSGTPRDAVMFSDGEGRQEVAAVDLSGFRSVGLYGVGANVKGGLDTATAAAAVERWTAWLIGRGATNPTVSTQAMF